MKDNAFVPCVGMVCKDLHIRGITGSEYIGVRIRWYELFSCKNRWL